MSAILCFPFAGGSEGSFAFLKPFLPPDIQLKTIEYPGHGRRLQEQPLTDLDAIVDDAVQQIHSFLDDDYILYGHSMGACVAFFCAERIWRAALPLPVRLVLSGHGAVTGTSTKNRHLLPREDFISMLRRMQGTPAEVLAHDELLRLFEPVLRADFAAVDTFRRSSLPVLPLDLTLFHGRDDQWTSAEEVRHWRHLVSGTTELEVLSGGHFFIREHGRHISHKLLADLPPSAAVA